MTSYPFENTKNIPKHVAIIMDGNGRWATKRGLPRTAGHKRGAEAAKKVVKEASVLGIQYLTLFGFSSENWNRPRSEVKDLMTLLRFYLRSETADMHKNNIRLRVIGCRERLDGDIVKLINNAEELTSGNDGLTVVIALNYGGRHDILRAAHSCAKEAVENGVSPDFEEMDNLFSARLMTHDIPDPDILIRTSGEQRISNFLLWQCAYAEFIFTDVLWPDFDRSALEDVLREYIERERRFGAIKQLEG